MSIRNNRRCRCVCEGQQDDTILSSVIIAEWGKKSLLTQSNYLRLFVQIIPPTQSGHNQVSITVYVAEDKADEISRMGRDYLQLESSGGTKVRTVQLDTGQNARFVVTAAEMFAQGNDR